MANRYGVLGGVIVLAAMGGCQTTSSLSNVEATYLFENVRQTSTFDEWTSIRTILNRHAKKPATSEIVRSSSNGGVRVSTYKATAALPNVKALNEIQADLEDLASERVAGNRIQFALAGASMTYRSNSLAVGVEVTVSGVAAARFVVRIYQDEKKFVETTADRSGKWSVRLPVIPAARWVYGVSTDPSGVVPARYFRVDVSTQKQEDLDESEFRKAVPGATKPAK